MGMISVPVNADQEKKINTLISHGYGNNKAAIFRRALDKLSEDAAVAAVLASEMAASEGKVFRGDLRALLKKFKAA